MENTISDGATTTPLVRQTKTIAEVVAAWLAASQPRLKASTYRSYVQGYDRYVLPTFGGHRIAAVTSEHVEASVAGLQRDGLARRPSGISSSG